MPVEAVDTHLSAIQQAVDKLLRVGSDPPMLLHVEFQAWHDSELDDRVLFYHCAIRRRERLPVHSVVFVLERKACRQDNHGGVAHVSPYEGCRLQFTYQVIKVWELPPEAFLQAGVGLLPLAPLADVSENRLPAVIETMTERLSREVARPEAAELWTATNFLMGLKYETALVELMLQKVRSVMQESTTYQALRKEAQEEGAVLALRSTILRQGSRRFGNPQESALNCIQGIHDPQVLGGILDRLHDASTWDDLLDEIDPAI